MGHSEHVARDARAPGELFTDEAKPRQVLPLADMVMLCTDDARPWKEAAELVLDALVAVGYGGLHVLSPGRRARALSAALMRELLADQRGAEGWHVQAFVDLNNPHATEPAPAAGLTLDAAGLLRWLRVQWIERGNAAACLTAGRLGDIAMPLLDAQRLLPQISQLNFGEGAPSPAVALPAQAGPVAQVMRRAQSVGTWGPLLARDAQGRAVPLVRIADAVRGLVAARPMLDGEALGLLSDCWSAASGPVSYLLKPGDQYAEPVSDSTVFEAGAPEVQGGLQPVLAGRIRSGHEFPRHKLAMVKGRPGQAEQRGLAGALVVLRKLASSAAGAAALDEPRRPVSWLAISAADLAELVRGLLGEAPEPVPLVPTLTVKTTGVAQPWTDERVASRLDELKAVVPKLHAPMVTLLAEMGLDATEAHKKAVQRRVNAHKAATQPATLEKAWSSTSRKVRQT